MIFFLGSHKPHWLGVVTVPLFLSRRRLIEVKAPRPALGPWALDSGAFTELSRQGCWTVTPRQYVSEVCRWLDAPGRLQWWAQQDWMCEPWILQKTGGTVREHQQRTTENYLALADIMWEFPPVPVLQGWEFDDYLRHVEDYAATGVNLASLPLVGLGSVCRRQNTDLVEELVHHLASLGIRLHAFGLKLSGLARCASWLASADSMAWSLDARRSPPLAGCPHRSCANCLRWALAWRERILGVVQRTLAQPMRQATLY